MSKLPSHSVIEANWKPYARLNHPGLSSRQLSWLLDASSLTQRLVSGCDGQFRVEVLSEQWIKPMISERKLLDMKHGMLARVRHVRLLCNERPCVFARTVIPYSTLRGSVRRLTLLGSRSLGAVLFADPTMRRGELEIAAIGKSEFLYNQAMKGIRQKTDPICGRRSVFYLSDKPLLVNEIFLPGIELLK